MRLPVLTSEGYQGTTLVLDIERETLSVLARDGSELGSVPWAEVIDFAVRKTHGAVAGDGSERMIPLALKVRYQAGGTVSGEGLTAEFGGGGFFLETGTPLPIGTELAVEFALPDHPQQKITTKALVVRVRKKPERQLFLPGMEVRFIDLAETDRQQVSTLITALERTRSPRR